MLIALPRPLKRSLSMLCAIFIKDNKTMISCAKTQAPCYRNEQ